MAEKRDSKAQRRLFQETYDRLEALAIAHLSGERDGDVLRPAELIHEAYLRLSSAEQVQFRSEGEFLALASEVMRHVLVDQARRRRTGKRGGGWTRIDLTDDVAFTQQDMMLVIILDRALRQLERVSPSQAQVMRMRVFGGMKDTEIAVVLECTDRWVRTLARRARVWLAEHIEGEGGGTRDSR